MKLIPITPTKSLNKAVLKQGLRREQLETFRDGLVRLLDKVNEKESEEHLKNLVSEFLRNIGFGRDYEINTRDRTDLAIHLGKSSADAVGVLIEVKHPNNRTEMISPEKPNAKAFHELVKNFMQERFVRGNRDIRRLVVCNVYEWYIFDAADFESLFLANKKFVNAYKNWSDGFLSGTRTDWFYQEVAKPFIEENLSDLTCTAFDLRDFGRIARSASDAETAKLVALCKALSPVHLLKQSIGNDSNSLNKEFYTELLHILGLEEIREKNKKLIRRKAAGARMAGSFLENTIERLKSRKMMSTTREPSRFGETEEEQYFSAALELCINWLNRILFLKLLEGRLIAWNRGDRERAFLNGHRVGGFDELNELFFDVLAVRPEERSEPARKRFGDVPYLNSSLFEESELEREAVRIADLKRRLTLPIYSATVLRDGAGRRIAGEKNTLEYLFEFLDAYDFAAEGSGGILERNRTIINASVLGLIFEKINGYRDGSYFTPGFITMSICRETIRRALIRKFNERYGWSYSNFTELYNALDKISTEEANEVVDSLRICDPAVGSGHFLVSALNEILAVKSELHILADRHGKKLRGYEVGVQNDELVVTCEDQLFEYNPMDPESQRVQETLFHEKEKILDNCLFGVDINSKSVMICRLRLWIELLKHAYYLPDAGDGQPRRLETLPNIDINIKCGNSLVSRFSLSGNSAIRPDERKKLAELTEIYRQRVVEYKMGPSNKALLREVIEQQKVKLQRLALPRDRDIVNLRIKEDELAQISLFIPGPKEAAELKKRNDEVEAIRMRIEDRRRTDYADAFEWRFEFPEVLDNSGEFAGFDAVIGNPPYIRHELFKNRKKLLSEAHSDFFCGTADICTYFYKVGLDIAKPGGILCYIAANKFMRAGYGRNTRELLTTESTPLRILDFSDLPVFEEATTYPAIVMVEKKPRSAPGKPRRSRRRSIRASTSDAKFLAATFTILEELPHFEELTKTSGFFMPVSALSPGGWTLERSEGLALMQKLRNTGTPLGEYLQGKFYRGVLTGLNKAFEIDETKRKQLITEDPRSADLIKPWLRGRDVKKWKANWTGLYVIFTRRGTDIEKYPAIKRHLEAFRAELEPKKPPKKRAGEKPEENQPGRKPGSYKWFEIQDNIAYFEEYDKLKIVYQEIATFQSFGYAEPGLFCNNKCFIIPETDDFLLALLNSKLFWWFLGNLTQGLVGGARAMQSPYMKQLPIATASNTSTVKIVDYVQKILVDSNGPDVAQLEAEIDRLVYGLYGLTEEEIALVEGSTRNPRRESLPV